MALATSVTGDGKIISDDETTQQKSIEVTDDAGAVLEYRTQLITSIRERREWYALTYAAARTYVDAQTQPAEGAYSFSIPIDDPIIPSYKLVREYNRDITGPALSLEPCDDPTFDPDGGEFDSGDYPVTVTITSATENSEIRYFTVIAGVVSATADIDSGDTMAIPAAGTVYAYAFKAGRMPSDMVDAVFTEAP